MRVSVVVPTYKRPDLLERCLIALAAQDFDPDDCEVIVADDGASEATRRRVEAWADYTNIRYRYVAPTTTHGPAAARNAGWRAAKGRVIAFTDDDCVPDPGWLSEGVAAIESGADAVSGRVIVPLPIRPTDHQRDAAGLQTAEFVTANCFVRRDALEAVGGFDERYATAWREDSDLQFSLLDHGFRLERAPRAVVVHPVRPARWGVSLHQQRKSLFNALLYKKFPKRYRKGIQAAPPWGYYATVGAMGGALISVALGWTAAAAGALAVWGALTARFCAKRLRGTSRAPGHLAEMAVTSALIPPLSVFWRLYGAWKFRVPFL